MQIDDPKNEACCDDRRNNLPAFRDDANESLKGEGWNFLHLTGIELGAAISRMATDR